MFESQNAGEFFRKCARSLPLDASNKGTRKDAMERLQSSSAPPRDPVIANARAEAFVAATRAKIIHEGHRAFYWPSTDSIHMPPRFVFIGTSTSSPTGAYYSPFSMS